MTSFSGLRVVCSVLCSTLFADCIFSLSNFDDSAIFRLDWPGHTSKADELIKQHAENVLKTEDSVVVSSLQNEQYICSLPVVEKNHAHQALEYFGPAPQDLVKLLYDQRVCTYRIEAFWTYEFCHGQYLLQYHEEKDLRQAQSNRQEYYLGQYIPESDTQSNGVDYILNPPKRKVDDQSLSYYAVKYTQGTLCDIGGVARQTTVFYVCDPEGKNQIHTFDEISTCEYELVVLTPRLCSHPGFKTFKSKEHTVECYPLNAGTPSVPKALSLWEKQRKWHERLETQQRIKVLPSVPNFQVDFDSLFKSNKFTPAKKKSSDVGITTDNSFVAPPPSDDSILRAFLSGDHCLYGGNADGWWKYEFCHGKHVAQYHEETTEGHDYAHVDTKILLGAWDQGAHVKWLKERPHKKPSQSPSMGSRKFSVVQTNHFYSKGDFCQEIEKPRSVEVRLKCKENLSSPNAVSLFLLEPRVCEYVLGVESQMFCEALKNIDENTGLFKQANQPQHSEL